MLERADSLENLEPGKFITVGNSIYSVCAACGRLVKINKWLFGGLHVCSPREDNGPYGWSG